MTSKLNDIFCSRRMFPSLQIHISGLDPHASYCIVLEMIPISNCRYKYTNSGGWTPSGTVEAQSPVRHYLHPESPSNGEYWMSQPVSFGRLKLTNVPAPPGGQIVLSSMHKYQPRIIISQTSDPMAIAWAPTRSFIFPETQFIAVTAYQNEKITKLKIDHNPFAKGFRETGQAKRKRSDLNDSEEERDSKHVKDDKLSPIMVEEDRSSPDSSLNSPCLAESDQSENDHVDLGSMPTTSKLMSSSPQASQSVSLSYKPYLPQPYSNYFQPQVSTIYPMHAAFYPMYSPFCHSTPRLIPQPTAEDLSLQRRAIEPIKKITDFSIRTIIGCS